MKKVFASLAFLLLSSVVFAQKFTTADIDNEIYSILDYAQLKGYCSFLSGAKPYTESVILRALNEVLNYEDKLDKEEVEYINDWIESHNNRQENKDLKHGKYRIDNHSEKIPFTFNFNYGLETFITGGIYTDSQFSQYGFDVVPEFQFAGDFSKWMSYRLYGFFDVSSMKEYECGDYFIGYSWYDPKVKEFLEGEYKDDEKTQKYEEPTRRTIKKTRLNQVLPYSYVKKWDGQIYLFSNMSASGLEGWASENGLSGGIDAELNVGLFEDKLQVKFGRGYHEWAAMDNGSSLILNSKARPFMAIQFDVTPFPFISYSYLTGSLEYANRGDILKNSYAGETYLDDAFFSQNNFSINMIELNMKYFHFDFGSSVIWPKRLELGYLFPLVNYVLYQNNLGDYDNLAMFSDIKLRYPGIGSVWGSIYLEELNGINNDVTTSTRAMFAGQLGTKIIIPGLPFASLSLRYTKVEPYCYTHQSINYTPWYNHYISESYTNNGYPLGYYLDPNSDETYLKFEMKPISTVSTSFTYQFIRHGADFGSQQVPGSSYYSELSPKNRDELEKHFLRDGAYNWMHIVSLNAAYTSKKSKYPFEIGATIGFLYSYYTVIDQDVYDKRDMVNNYGGNGNSGADKNTAYHFIDTDEYPVQCGVVLSLGVKVLNW